MKVGIALTGISLMVIGAAISTPAVAQQATAPPSAEGSECGGRLDGLELPGHDLRITKPRRVSDAPAGTVRENAFWTPISVAIPGYCKVEGVIDPREGVDGVAYGLRFELALPDDWNGRFLFQGGAGFNGTVNPALGSTAAGEVPAIARGFAVVSTDSGHAGDAGSTTHSSRISARRSISRSIRCRPSAPLPRQSSPPITVSPRITAISWAARPVGAKA